MVTSPPRPQDFAQLMQDQFQQMFLRTQKALELAVDIDDANVGQTPKDVVWQRGRTQLYHYQPMAERTVATPLLMVHSLISKPYILDLYPGGSFVEFVLRRGFDVYLLDWGTPTEADRGLRLEDYTQKLIPAAVRLIARTSPTRRVSLLGYCMGGLLTTLYAALHPRAPIDAIVCLTTPVDFHQMGLFSTWTDRRYFDVDSLVDRLGNVPAEFLRRSFSMLKPASEFSPVRYINLWQNILNDRYVEQYRAFNKWTNDHIPFPGECFRQVVKDLQWDNKLIKDELTIGGKPARLGAIKRPFLHITAKRDHIVPPASAALLVPMVGSTDKEQIFLDGGHVGVVAGRAAVRDLWPRVADWLAARSSSGNRETNRRCTPIPADRHR
jgi:polyhydroxyalkanoate synthase